MSSTWRITSESDYPASDNPFGNTFFGYRSTKVKLPDSHEATYHGVVVDSCLHVVAIDEDLTTYMVRQRRPNARAVGSTSIPETLELPGGFQKTGLEIQAAANQELIEEIGKRAGSLTLIGTLYPSPGISNEIDTIFLGRELEQYTSLEAIESTEQDLRIVAEPFGKLYNSMTHGVQPVSAQTLAAMAMAANYL